MACQLQLPERAFPNTDLDFEKGPFYCIPRQFLGATAGLQQGRSTSRDHLHSPSKHLLAPTVRTVQSTGWQVPLPNMHQVKASYMLTPTTTSTAHVQGVAVSQPLLEDPCPLQPLADSCSSFTVSSRATPQGGLCFPVWVGALLLGCLGPLSTLVLIHSFTHSLTPSLPAHFIGCQMGTFSSQTLD